MGRGLIGRLIERKAMTKYLLLYRSSVSAAEQLASGTPEQAQAGMEAWMACGQRAGDAIVDFGSPVTPVTATGDRGGEADSRPIGGFSVLQAESLDALTSLLKDHPHLHAPDASIEVLEFVATPGSA
jgi:hypothetical protein